MVGVSGEGVDMALAGRLGLDSGGGAEELGRREPVVWAASVVDPASVVLFCRKPVTTIGRRKILDFV